MWGLSPSDGNAAINAYKIAQGITNPCAGTEGGGPDAIDVVIAGQPFYGYPTYIVVCPDKTMYFDVCWPPSSASCFDTYIEDCGYVALSANFSSDLTEICQYDAVSYQDMSVGNITSWNWTFEGGDPATSTEQNPVVTYNEAGSYDVELEVSDGSNSATHFIEDYMVVLITPPAMLLPFDDVCDTDPSFMLTGGSPAGGVYSGTGVSNGYFDPAVAGLGTHTITYTYTASNGCENSAEQTLFVDECTGLEEAGENSFQVYPNPTSGEFEISFFSAGDASIQVFNILGMKVAQFISYGNGSIQQKVNIGNHENGIYFVYINTGSETWVKKIKLVKH
jgi:PKD repeat protein